MNFKTLFLAAALFATSEAAQCASTPTVEFRGSFIKITAGAILPDAPVEPNPPELLYIRKSSIQSISMTFLPRTVFYDVVIVTLDPESGARPGNGNVVITNFSKSYIYRFTNEASAAAFCEALISNQEG